MAPEWTRAGYTGYLKDKVIKVTDNLVQPDSDVNLEDSNERNLVQPDSDVNLENNSSEISLVQPESDVNSGVDSLSCLRLAYSDEYMGSTEEDEKDDEEDNVV